MRANTTRDSHRAQRCLRRVAIPTAVLAAAAALFGCATTSGTSAPASCVDLSGRYENQSTPAGHKLAPFFFGSDDRADEIEIVSQGSKIAISTPTRNTVLAIELDFVCAAEGIRLTKTEVRNIRLPPLLVEKETFHYVFGKAPDGALQMTEQVESQGKSFGIPMGTGQKQQRAQVRWRSAPPR